MSTQTHQVGAHFTGLNEGVLMKKLIPKLLVSAFSSRQFQIFSAIFFVAQLKDLNTVPY